MSVMMKVRKTEEEEALRRDEEEEETVERTLNKVKVKN